MDAATLIETRTGNAGETIEIWKIAGAGLRNKKGADAFVMLVDGFNPLGEQSARDMVAKVGHGWSRAYVETELRIIAK